MVSFCPQQTYNQKYYIYMQKTSFQLKIFINILISLRKLQYLPDHCLPRVCQYGDEQRPVGGVHHRQPWDWDDHGVARAEHQTGRLLGAGGVRAQVRGPIGMEKKYWCFVLLWRANSERRSFNSWGPGAWIQHVKPNLLLLSLRYLPVLTQAISVFLRSQDRLLQSRIFNLLEKLLGDSKPVHKQVRVWDEMRKKWSRPNLIQVGTLWETQKRVWEVCFRPWTHER